jgi:hypothetical protein
MRLLAQPRVLVRAIIAGMATALASLPRMLLWPSHPAPIWYLEAMIFLCSIVLWGFVFAWHEPYSKQPVWRFKLEPKWFIVATLTAIIAAAAYQYLLDPSFRAQAPKEYPADLNNWLAQVLFSLFLTQLFLLFAPFAWLMRLIRNRWVAAVLTVLFSAFVWMMKNQSLPAPIQGTLFAALLTGRIVMGFLAVWLYLRGGILLIWWWTILFEARLLPDLAGHP